MQIHLINNLEPLKFNSIYGNNDFVKNALLLFFLSFFLFFLAKVNAQPSTQQFDNVQDSSGYFHLDEANNLIEKDSLNKAEKLLDICEKWAIAKQDDFLIMKICFSEAQLNYQKDQYNHALQLYQDVWGLSKVAKDTTFMIKSLSALSELYNELSFSDSAFFYCEKELKLNKARKNFSAVSGNFRRLFTYIRYSIGGITESRFIINGFLDSSLAYAKKSKRPGAIVFAMANIARNTHADNPEKGLGLTKASIDSARKLPLPNEALVYALLQSYQNYWDAGQFQIAEKNLLEALPMALVFGRPSWIGHIYWLLGRIENSKSNNDLALRYLRKAVFYSEKENISPLKRSIYSSIRNVYKEVGNIDSTLYYMEKYSELAQKAHDIAMNKQIALLSARFKVEEKEEKIKLLDEVNQQKEEKIYLQNRFIITLTVSFVSVLLLLGVFYFQYKKTQKAYLVLTRKNTEIKEQRKEIRRLNGEKRASVEIKLEPQKMKLVDLFEKDKIYLDKNLNLQTVASQLDTNTSYLSTLINSSYKCNFTHFVNKYRVLEACEILNNEQNEIYTMEGIAEMSGFISKSVFNKAFKENTGLTPSIFRKNIKANGN